MAKKVEEVIYCDACSTRVEKSSLGLVCERPRVQGSAVSQLEVDDERAVSVVTLGNAKGDSVTLVDHALCKDCLSKAFGFTNAQEMRDAQDALKRHRDAEYERMNRRGGPGDR